VQLVGQVVGHLGCEVGSDTRGGDLEGVILADQGHFPAGFVPHGDPVGSIAVNVRAHCFPRSVPAEALAACADRRSSVPLHIRVPPDRP
jgi:hypothetical protein